MLENSRYLLKSFNEILELADGDEGTSALMGDLIGAAEKRIWMFGLIICTNNNRKGYLIRLR